MPHFFFLDAFFFFQVILMFFGNLAVKDSGAQNIWQGLIADVIRTNRKMVTTTTTTTTTATTTTTSKHNRVVTDLDKAPLLAYLNNIPNNKKWKLNCSGRYVEDIIAEAIKDCSYEHLCYHPLWTDLLTDKEREEIKNHNRPQMPSIDQDVQSYIDSFGQDAFVSASDFYNHAVSNSNPFKFGQDHLKRWVQQAIINAAQLFEASDELMVEDYSENGLLNFVWQFVYHAFRTGNVKAKLGERSSTSSVLGKNEGRSLESNGRRERKTVGAKVDMLFKTGRYELGCSEIGKGDVLPIDNRYLDDGMSKLPKTLRDMFCQLVEANPSMINKLNTIGFLMMGLDLELLIVDVPEGTTVSRVTRSKKLAFPNKGSNLRSDFLPLLEVTLLGRGLMIEATRTVESRKRKAVEETYHSNTSIWKISSFEYQTDVNAATTVATNTTPPVAAAAAPSIASAPFVASASPASPAATLSSHRGRPRKRKTRA
ncbi:hypothetical protein BDF21DRAFT_454895 [Thamnidium elegans]|nr:hypothetical protein BDF21DRAFT_454895 [Thamnidium elegans]